MKNYRHSLIAVTMLLSLGKVSAQAGFSEPALYKVSYKFSHAYDTTDLQKKQVANMNLYVGQTYSSYRYVGYEAFLKEKALLIDVIAEWSKTRDMSKPIQMSKTMRQVPETEILKKLTGYTIYKKEALMGKDYVMEDSLSPIEWEIKPETKMLGGITAQKAEGFFRGRKYSAWFAPEFPVQAGPWKLSGLPGIILEASDEKKEVVFSFAGFEQLPKQNSALIVLSDGYFKAKEPEFQKLKKMAQEDPGAFFSNRQMQTGITVTVNGQSLESLANSVPRKKAVKTVVNNPMEIIQK